MKLLVAMLPTIILTSYTQLVMKWRVSMLLAAAAAQSQSVPERISAYLLDPFIVSAYAFALLSSIAWLFVVERHPASIAFPIYIGVLFSVVTVGSTLWLKETISIQHLVGLALIIVGIFVVSRAA
jgi:multidrug transporter EmrE-like cation transporter